MSREKINPRSLEAIEQEISISTKNTDQLKAELQTAEKAFEANRQAFMKTNTLINNSQQADEKETLRARLKEHSEVSKVLAAKITDIGKQLNQELDNLTKLLKEQSEKRELPKVAVTKDSPAPWSPSVKVNFDKLRDIHPFLSNLQKQEVITSYLVTYNTFNVTLPNNEKFTLNEDTVTLTVRGNSDLTYETAIQTVIAAGGKSLDLSKITDKNKQYQFYKAAQKEKLEVTGLSPMDLETCQDKYNEEKTQSSAPSSKK